MELPEVLERTERAVRDVIAPAAEEIDREARWPKEGIRALQDAGLGGLVAPTEHGGCGQGLEAVVRVCETIGQADPSTGLCFGMHQVGLACIAAKVTDEQAAAFLEPACRGDHLTTLALSEPGTGSHFYLPETRVVHKEGDFLVDGEKVFVTNGGHADSYVLSCVAADPGAPPGHFSLVVVPEGLDGMTWGPSWAGWGMRGNSSRGLSLEETRVPGENLLGEEGDQIWYAFNVVAPYFLAAMAGTYIGIAERAVEEATEHMKRRAHSHTGAPLSEVSILQHRLGEVWAQKERTRQLILAAARRGDAGEPEALPSLCTAKAEVAHATVDVVNACMTLVGGQAYRDGTVLQRLLRDARAAHIMSPTTDMLYTWAGRALLDVPLLGE